MRLNILLTASTGHDQIKIGTNEIPDVSFGLTNKSGQLVSGTIQEHQRHVQWEGCRSEILEKAFAYKSKDHYSDIDPKPERFIGLAKRQSYFNFDRA